MKRAIFVLIFLTIVVALPPFYLQWAESQRLNQIQEVKQQARPVFGERLETVLSELKSSESPSVIILYTGGTKSHLEPCVVDFETKEFQRQAGPFVDTFALSTKL